MGYRFICEDRIEVEDGQLVRIVNARWANKKTSGNLDVYKLYEDGRELVRNLSFNYFGFYYLHTSEVDEWSEPVITLGSFRNGRSMDVTDSEMELVKSRYPEFRWMLDKAMASYCGAMTRATMWKFLEAWKRWPECERLLNGGYEKLCLSEPFAKAPYRLQHRIFEFLMSHPDVKNPGWSEVLSIMKYGTTQEEYSVMKSLRVGVRLYRYLVRQKIAKHYDMYAKKGYYDDYIHMAAKNGHDTRDEYWKFPNNLAKAHSKVLRESKAIALAMQKQRELDYRKSVEEWLGKEVNLGGVTVHVAGTISEWKAQADALDQCILWGDYLDRVMEGRCLLLFVMCDGKPVATAELDTKGKIVQFNADQHDMDNIEPTSEAKEAVNMWIDQFRPKLKPVKEVA